MSIMSYSFIVRSIMGLALVVAVVWTIGCRGEKQPPAAVVQGGDATVLPGLAKLSPEDRELALRQKVCPVSGAVLGEMGPPIKVYVKGRVVLLCCPSCEEPLMQQPDRYLTKLGM